MAALWQSRQATFAAAMPLWLNWLTIPGDSSRWQVTQSSVLLASTSTCCRLTRAPAWLITKTTNAAPTTTITATRPKITMRIVFRGLEGCSTLPSSISGICYFKLHLFVINCRGTKFYALTKAKNSPTDSIDLSVIMSINFSLTRKILPLTLVARSKR
jgi:hypothetical protein